MLLHYKGKIDQAKYDWVEINKNKTEKNIPDIIDRNLTKD